MKNKLIIATLLSIGFISTSFAAEINELPQLSVNGSATLFKPADQLSFSIGVYTENADVEEASKANAIKMEAVVNALKQAGLTKDEYQTGSFTVSPVYSRQPKDPPADWRATVLAYRVQNELLIKTTQLERSGSLIDAINKAGADTINEIAFSLKEKEAAQNEAIAAATANALSNAKTLAESAQLSLKRVIKISLDQVGPSSPNYRTKMLFGAQGGNSPSTSIEAGQIEVNATISVLYEIE